MHNIKEDLATTKQRLSSVETQLAHIHGNNALTHSRIDSFGHGDRRPVSGRFRMEPHAERARDLEDGCEAGIPVLAESLVETLAAEAGIARNLRHALCASDIAEGAGDARYVVRCLSQPGVEVPTSIKRYERGRMPSSSAGTIGGALCVATLASTPLH